MFIEPFVIAHQAEVGLSEVIGIVEEFTKIQILLVCYFFGGCGAIGIFNDQIQVVVEGKNVFKDFTNAFILRLGFEI